MEENKDTELGREAIERLHPMLLLREVANKALAIILVAIIAMSCTYVFVTATYVPRYQTKTTFVVSTRNGASSVSSNFNTAKGLAASFSQIIGSDVMEKKIARELGVSKIHGTIDAELIESTNVLELNITASNPRTAYMITSTLLKNYKPLVEQTLGNVALDILQYPTVPTAPVNPLGTVKPVALAGFAAIFAVAALLCVIAYIRDTVKTAEEAEDKLDAKVLGIVRHESKYKTLKSKLQHKKTSILLTNSTTGFDFVETFKKLRTRIDYAMRKNKYKTLMVSSVLEDEGKSTVAVNLALAMKKKYDKVLIIDADLKKSSMYKILEYKQKKFATINEVLEGKVEFEDALVVHEASGVHLLLGRNGIEDSTELVSGERMKELIEKAKSCMDIVIIDTPPMSVSPDAECIAEITDAAVLVVRQDMAPVRVINDMIDEINLSKANLLGCILNNFRAADIDDSFSYGQSRYGYGKYGYGKYGYGKYGYSKYGYSKYGYSKYGYGRYGYGKSRTSEQNKEGM